MARIVEGGSVTRLEDKPRNRCKKWVLRIKRDGTTKTRRFSGTYTQAQEALVDFERELKRVEDESPKRTFESYANEWLEYRRHQRDLSKNTLARDSVRVRNLITYFGHMELDAIDRRTVKDGIVAIQEGHNLSGRRLSGTTTNGIFVTLKAILQEACFDGYIDVNPALSVRAPKKDTEKKRALGIDDVRRVLARLEMMPLTGYTIALRFALLSGMRSGEIVGLEWGDIQESFIEVNRSVSRRTGEIKTPKTESGYRAIPLLEPLRASLIRWKYQQALELHAHGCVQGFSTPICTSADGTRLDANNLYRWWRKNASRYFDVECSLHELRHTFLTLLGSSGATSIALKSLAGWSNISMADVYLHENDKANLEAMNAFNLQLFGGATLPAT